MIIKYRSNFVDLINERNYKIICEIGVATGGFANLLLYKCSCIEKYYGIDPFGNNYDPDPIISNFIGFKCTIDVPSKKLKPYGNKVQLIQQLSEKAIYSFNDNFFDFIYIDGNHSYESVKLDLELYWPKLKKGGVMAGHDYDYRAQGVIDAVDQFVLKNNLKLNLTEKEFPGRLDYDDKEFGGMEADSISWWVEK